MSLRRAGVRLWKLSRLPLLLVLLTGASCWEPVPDRPQGPAASLSVVPHELFVYVANPTQATSVNVIAFVQDSWGRNLADHSTTFSVREEGAEPGSGTGSLFTLSKIGASSDSVALTIAQACAPTDPTCAPVDRDAVVTAEHAASGLHASIVVHVRYDKLGDHGVAAPGDSPWPMVGLASASMANAWVPLATRAFFTRSGFGKFDAGGAAPPAGDEPAGTVFSPAHAAWRQVRPWGTVPGDMQVPAGSASAPATVAVRAYYAASATAGAFAGVQTSYTIALQAAADLVSATPVGAKVELQAVRDLGSLVPWSSSCTTIANALNNHVPPIPASDLPAPSVLSVYMLGDPAAGTESPRAMRCGPQHLATSPFPNTHLIVLPAGTPLASAIAHEIGHTFGLDHVSVGGGFNDDNLMATSDEQSAPMRSRLTIGQAFRAALDPESHLVTTGRAKSGPVDCDVTPLKCPALSRDIVRRSPP
jgi:hypothetical protein